MITMPQRAELHRILDNCILLSNTDHKILFSFTQNSLQLGCRDKNDGNAIFLNTNFANMFSCQDLQKTAEDLESEMGVD